MTQEEQEQGGNFKKIIWIGVIAVLGVLIVAAGIVFLIRSTQYTYFYDKYYKIQIKHPKDWAVHKQFAGTIVTLVSPKDDELDNFNENLNISVSDLPPQGMTLEQFSRIATQQTEAVFERNLEVIESQKIEFAGFPAYSYEVRSTQPPFLNLKFIWFFKDNKAYIITYAIQMLQYRKYHGKFNYMLDSFSIGVK